MRRLVAGAAWYVLPALVVAAVLGYLGLAVAWGVYPPVVPVQGVSMQPTLVTGDLVLLHAVNPDALHVGSVVAVSVPAAERQKYGLPARVVHRIIRVTRGPEGLIFQTKGDSNSGPDVFATPATAVIGVMTGHVPYLGYPVLFFRSRQGEIFLGVAALVVVIYLLLGWVEAKEPGEPAGGQLDQLLAETRQLREVLESRVAGPLTAATGAPSPPTEAFAQLAEAVSACTHQDQQTHDALRMFSQAIGDYAEHLSSHTAVMQALAATTAELQDTVGDLRAALVAVPALAPLATGTPPAAGLAAGGTSSPAAAPVAAEIGRSISSQDR